MAFEYTIIGLAIAFYAGWMFVWSFHIIAIIYGNYKFHKKAAPISDKQKLPGVSIIKPLMGIDENLTSNLETFFTIDYPKYELLFCVQDKTDPVINIVNNLIKKYPNIDCQLFSGGTHVGINPKVNNMMQGYDKCKYDLFMISDAGLRMEKDTLYDMVSLMTDKVGLVHQMPYVCDRPGFAGTLEKVYFGTCHCRMYLAINCIGINCVTGMSCLMRKKVIDDAGGLKSFGHYIAEDYFLAQEFLSKNWVIQLSHQPALQNSGTYSVQSWQSRMVRWCKLRLKLNIMAWLEPLQECFAIGLGASWAVNFLFNWNSLVFFLIHVLCWFLSDYVLLKTVQNSKLPFTKFDYVVAWLYRECIYTYLFMKAAFNPTVQWRHGTYRLRWGGLAEEISSVANNKQSLPSPSTPTTIDKKQTNSYSSQQQQQTPITTKLQQFNKAASLLHSNSINNNHQSTHNQQINSTSTLSLIQQIPTTTSSILTTQSTAVLINT